MNNGFGNQQRNEDLASLQRQWQVGFQLTHPF
jgi:hypothetical protein